MKKEKVFREMLDVTNQAFEISEEEGKTEELVKTCILTALSFVFLPIGLNFIVAKKISSKLDGLADKIQIEEDS